MISSVLSKVNRSLAREVGLSFREDQSQFKSRKGALVWSFKKSRDNWKSKYQSIKADEVKLRKKLAYLTDAREKERAVADEREQEIAKLIEETRQLRTLNSALEAKLAAVDHHPKKIFATIEGSAR